MYCQADLQQCTAGMRSFLRLPNVGFSPRLVVLMMWLFALHLTDTCVATIVRFETSLGTVDVRLYDAATPLSVANFLNFANANRYDGTFIHRNPPGFVVQGGGFEFIPPDMVAPVVDPANPDPPVLNEPGISNLRGTIAMAKLGGDPDSATSQWFFNLTDNSGPPAELDSQNGGFTVFGRVILDGMDVVDAIDQLPVFDLDGATGQTFNQVPLRGTLDDALADRLVFIESVDVLNIPRGDYDFNGTVDTADYELWRSTLGSTTDAAADGNGNGVVDAADYTVWRDTLGQTTAVGSGALVAGVPEPAAATLMLSVGIVAALNLPRRRRR